MCFGTFSPSMRESCAVRLTIRYLLMFVHRRDLGQSSVSRLPLGSDRARVCYAKSHLYTLIQKNPVYLILGAGGMRGGGFWILLLQKRKSLCFYKGTNT